MKKLWNWLLAREDLTPPGSDEQYLIRWRLLSLPGGRRVYLHKFVGDDWSRDPHDHPKDFTSIGLWGEYEEEVYLTQAWQIPLFRSRVVRWRAPFIRYFKAETIHRIRLIDGKPAWTLVFTGAVRRPWGFYKPDGTFMTHKEYLEQLSDQA